MSSKYEALFQPMKVGSITIKNRIVMCPMGGVGLIVPGIIHITDMWGCGSWTHEVSEECMAKVRETLDEIHSYGCKMFVQIGAGMGRVLSIKSGMLPLDFNHVRAMRGPSEGLPNVWSPEKKHREMSKEEIQEIMDSYAVLSKRLKDADMDGVEIHAIHEGYLLDQFSISSTNWRKDEYGGSLENRMRFVVEIIHKIKAVCGQDFPVSVRFSVTSKMKGFNDGTLPGMPYAEFGRTMEDAPAVARILEETEETEDCALNPAAMQEKKYELTPASVKKHVYVIGRGIGGMEAARLAAMRGHDVTLCEKTDTLGGVFNAAAAPDFKESDRLLIRWYVNQLAKQGVKVLMNTTVDKEYITQAKPDEIIVATGAKPRQLPIKGIEGEHVIEACEYLLKEKEAGYLPNQTIAEGLRDMDNVHVIGDAKEVGSLMEVVWAAYDVALAI